MRKHIFSATAFLLFLALGPRCQAQGGSIAQFIRPAQPLTVVTPSDPRFDEEVAVYFNGIEGAEYAAIRPYLVLLVNDNPVGARGYAVTWRFTHPDGSTADHTEFYITTRLNFRPGFSRALPPGAARLVSPFFNLSAKQWNVNANLRATFLPGYVKRLEGYGGRGSTVSAHVDGVAYVDDTFNGKNRTMILQRYLCAVNAEHDEALLVYDDLKAGKNGGQILAELKQAERNGHDARRKYLPAIYVRARADTARQLLGYVGPKKGISRLIKAVTFLANKTPPAGRMTFMAPWYSPDYTYQPNHP